MVKIRVQPTVKLISGFIFSDDKILNNAKNELEKHFGRIDFESGISSFGHTDYYKEEFGNNLKRGFVSFKKLILPDSLARIKTITSALETRFSEKRKRAINIDPGWLDLSKLVLASTKDYKHRIYIGKGIFAEVTLFYQNKTFKPWDWTYPDYQTPEYIQIFNQIRQIYSQQIKNK